MKNVTVPISSILGGGICVSASDGHKIFAIIREHVVAGDRVVLSFSGVTRMTTAFLNAAVGQLYNEFSEEHVRRHLAPPVDAEPWHLTRLKLVVDRAKLFFKDADRVARVFKEATGQNDDDL
ncbi:STAS-like domain-containing protein [Mesorhizobium sp. B4-1-4]|uniref:STAS-like domain-containing protein n=1 Tax=Mesorhizobium sp. B4-1-4 TaxID=2589888 RepID=UPI001128D21D|nr:STAS-like domain-containing protein [Mesorhizobium sp. B4-1-4]UCI29449.1 STAS-like domain-containing protein [Mesorhizobium sp. B4-1-4]